MVQEKNSAKFCPKTQPYAGFSLLKNYKKNSLCGKNWYSCFQNSIFPPENSMHRRLQALSSLQKSVQKMPVLDFVVWGPVLVICEHTWYADTITSSGSIRVSQPQIVIRRQPRRFDDKDTLTTSQNVTFRCHKSDGSKYQFCAWHGPNMDSGQDCTLRQECGWIH